MTAVGSGEWRNSSHSLTGLGSRTVYRRIFCLSNVLSSGERVGGKGELSQQRLVLRKKWWEKKAGGRRASRARLRKSQSILNILNILFRKGGEITLRGWLVYKKRIEIQKYSIRITVPQSKAATSFYIPCSTPTGSSTSQSQLEYPPGHQAASCHRTSGSLNTTSATKSSDNNVIALPTLSTLLSVATTLPSPTKVVVSTIHHDFHTRSLSTTEVFSSF
ncbi:hypothetical protein E2C01_070906 [Portunus trituberculatus]|uniref:Uncharacterized protein n=1 Tax=Portunus trituberculatus TaxID=210409 RepID=A0A5B7HTY8_PORTR|nr:hypothetical protein [Portunus trituberculatus]